MDLVISCKNEFEQTEALFLKPLLRPLKDLLALLPIPSPQPHNIPSKPPASMERIHELFSKVNSLIGWCCSFQYIILPSRPPVKKLLFGKGDTTVTGPYYCWKIIINY